MNDTDTLATCDDCQTDIFRVIFLSHLKSSWFSIIVHIYHIFIKQQSFSNESSYNVNPLIMRGRR